MQQFDYFFYGIPADSNLPQYGLYNPVLNRFLLVTDNIDPLDECVKLCSSKFNLYVVELNTADNYLPTLIDNTCCQNWSFDNCDQLDIATLGFQRVRATKLVERPHMEVSTTQHWVRLVYFWVCWYINLKSKIKPNYELLEFIHRVVNIQDTNFLRLDNTIKQVQQILYIEKSAIVAETKLIKLIQVDGQSANLF